MCYNWSLVWHSNRKIHIIYNIKAPTVSSCFKFNGAEIVNSLFFTGVFYLAATAESSMTQHPGFLQSFALPPALPCWSRRLQGTEPFSLFHHVLIIWWSHQRVRCGSPSLWDIIYSVGFQEREFWTWTRDTSFTSCKFSTGYLTSELCSLVATWGGEPTYCKVDDTWQGRTY